MKRKTVSKRLTTKLKAYKDWIKANRVMPTAWLMQRTAAKLEGHYAYYGVTDNSRSIGNFAHLVKQILFKWLNRRGKRGCYTWEKFQKLLERYPLPAPRIKVNLLSFYGEVY
ncbi:group II intron maturase-specific domain-containing protein [Thiolapillus sp.]|uniref:group II intron maturase-specific domain-containing protein n=1 Tax=Thiolapillus sp. TaxID=2017437 RepID=UPI003AF5D729